MNANTRPCRHISRSARFLPRILSTGDTESAGDLTRKCPCQQGRTQKYYLMLMKIRYMDLQRGWHASSVKG